MAARQIGEDDVKINVDIVATKLASMMYGEDLCSSTRCCIFRVPNILLRHNPKAYEPNAFSIGPFNFKKSHLRATHKIKLKYLRDLISRSSYCITREMKLMNLTKAISEVWKEARECYAGPIDDEFTNDEFVQMLVLDGCFLIELFRRNTYENFKEKDDPIFSVSCMLQHLYHDLILLENQLPWFVLDLLFNMTMVADENHSLNIIAIFFMNYVFSRTVSLLDGHPVSLLDGRKNTHQSLLEKHKHKHFLDLLRNAIVLPSSIREQHSSSNPMMEWQQLPSATSLQEAGIKFKKAESPTSLLDIRFEKGFMEIPKLLIHETTESLFRNIICLEQCLPDYDGVITSYAILLDNLINTGKDMEILGKSEVIDNWLNNEEASEFFNQLYNDTFVNDFYYTELINKVNTYCQRRWPKYRRVLMHDYFKHPWALTSVIVAAILLILTFLQTFFTIIK